MSSSDNQIVQSAIARNAGIVVSLPSAGLFRHHKSRFLAENTEGIWVEIPANEQPLLNELVITGKPTGISFRQGALKTVFTAPVLRYEPEYRLNSDTSVAAALIGRPTEVKTVQRRSNYRVPVPAETELRVRVWRIGPGVPVRDRPMAKQELRAKLYNISLGGIGVVLEGEKDTPVKVMAEDRLRVCLLHGEEELILEGRMRYPTAPNNGVIRAGIQFKSLDKDIDGRQALTVLTRIVGELTRSELRRMRQGISDIAA